MKKSFTVVISAICVAVLCFAMAACAPEDPPVAEVPAEPGSYGAAEYGGANVPKPATVVMQYTGHSDYNPQGEPPTFACVGSSDGIANWRTMQRRIETLSAMGVPTEFHVYQGLGHGFGLGTGTVAEGWFDLAVNFWEENR